MNQAYENVDWNFYHTMFDSLITKAELREIWNADIREKDYAVATKASTITPFMPCVQRGLSLLFNVIISLTTLKTSLLLNFFCLYVEFYF